jgi:hypothetical protein
MQQLVLWFSPPMIQTSDLNVHFPLPLSLSLSLSLTVHALQEAPQKAQHATWWKQNYKYAGAAKVSKEKTMKLGKALPGS